MCIAHDLPRLHTDMVTPCVEYLHGNVEDGVAPEKNIHFLKASWILCLLLYMIKFVSESELLRISQDIENVLKILALFCKHM
jgi:hypothetical protein